MNNFNCLSLTTSIQQFNSGSNSFYGTMKCNTADDYPYENELLRLLSPVFSHENRKSSQTRTIKHGFSNNTGVEIEYFTKFDLLFDNAQNTNKLKVSECFNKQIVISKALLKIEQIKSLENNWNNNGASKFSEKLIERSISILNTLPFEPDVFPTARDSIQFEYEKASGEYLEFEIFETWINVFMINADESEDEYKLSSNENIKLKNLVEGFYCEVS